MRSVEEYASMFYSCLFTQIPENLSIWKITAESSNRFVKIQFYFWKILHLEVHKIWNKTVSDNAKGYCKYFARYHDFKLVFKL